MSVQFADIGFSNYVEANKILTINKPDGAPIKRMIQMAKDEGRFLDLTAGKKTRSIITQKLDNSIVIVASAVQTSTVVDRIRRAKSTKDVFEKESGDILKTTMEG